VGLIEDDPLEISSQRAVEGALQQLKSLIEVTGAVIEIGALPIVCANETQLMRVFQNLIGNSLKFTAAGEVPRITIGAELAGDMWVFSVTDEGIGIDPGCHEQVFVLFHRLNPRADYPGTGFGLTLCKRIVERHGGSMWIESSDDHGTTMRFSLPTRC
jgi:light-regulated signal transduction histidine kinase (bacteriophytochrome)